MIFSSAVFLFAFLPLVFLGYYVMPKKYALAFLFIINLVFYGWGEPIYLFLMLFSIAFNYGATLLLPRSPHKKLVLAAAIAVNLALIGYFKYAGFAVSSITGMIPAAAGIFSGFAPPSLPIGISFYTFQAMAYVFDVYRGDICAERNILKFGSYISLFPQLNAGPIVRYAEIADQLGKRGARLGDVEEGLIKFICGLSKKLLLANPVGSAWKAFETSPGNNGIAGAWIGLLAYAFHIYFDFSGYSDMAVGLGRMLGFRFPENFNYPYVSKSITEFWRRWHITLSSWFRDYVYIPFGGSRCGAARNLVNLLAVWLLTGLWHGASWNFVAWGLYFALLLIVERAFLLRIFDRFKLPSVLRRAYAFGFVVMGWGLFAITDLSWSFTYIAELFGIRGAGGTIIPQAGSGLPAQAELASLTLAGGAFFSPQALRYTAAYMPTLILCALAATPLPKRAWSAVAGLNQRLRVPEAAGALILLLLCVAAIAAGGYNPFIYFRF